MRDLNAHPSLDIVRLLNLGENGTGKTGVLASLVIAGYTLWVLDYDNGLDIIVNALKAHYKDDTDGLTAAKSRLKFELLRDEVSFTSGAPKVKDATAWKRSGEVMKTILAENSLGANDIVVIDSLTTMSQVAFNHGMKLEGRLLSGQRPRKQDYGWMADSVLLFIDALTADTPYNVVVNTHIRYLQGEDATAEDDNGNQVPAGDLRGLPNAKGQEISRNIGKYFNTVVLSRTVGSGPNTKRIISTQPQGVVEVKTSNPWGIKREYKVEDGLAPLFADILGRSPSQPVP